MSGHSAESASGSLWRRALEAIGKGDLALESLNPPRENAPEADKPNSEDTEASPPAAGKTALDLGSIPGLVPGTRPDIPEAPPEDSATASGDDALASRAGIFLENYRAAGETHRNTWRSSDSPAGERYQPLDAVEHLRSFMDAHGREAAEGILKQYDNKNSGEWPDVPYHYGMGRIKAYEDWLHALSEEERKREIKAAEERSIAYSTARATHLMKELMRAGHTPDLARIQHIPRVRVIDREKDGDGPQRTLQIRRPQKVMEFER